MNIETSKNLGGIGAILLFISVLPYANFLGILGLIGLILVLVALKGFADYYREGGIFSNALYGIIAGIVGIALAVVIAFTALVGFIQIIIPGWNGDWTALSQIDPTAISTNIGLSDVLPFVSALLLALVVLFVFAIIAAFLLRKSLRLLSARTGVGLFATTGLLLLIGAVLTILAIGVLLIWIALILLAVAFFSVKSEPAPPAPTVTMAQAPTPV